MNGQITDTVDVPLSYLALQQVELEDSAVLAIRIPARAGTWLTAADNAYLRVLARLNGTADAFVDIQDSPISLTPWAGVDEVGNIFTVDFDIKVHVNAVTGNRHEGVELKVTFNP